MTTVPVEEIQKNAETYFHKVEQGETLLVERDGVPVAEINPVTVKEKRLRPYGLCHGEFTVPDDFDAPLPDDILDAFESK